MKRTEELSFCQPSYSSQWLKFIDQPVLNRIDRGFKVKNYDFISVIICDQPLFGLLAEYNCDLHM